MGDKVWNNPSPSSWVVSRGDLSPLSDLMGEFHAGGAQQGTFLSPTRCLYPTQSWVEVPWNLKLSGIKFISGYMKGDFNPYIITNLLLQGHCLQLLVYTVSGEIRGLIFRHLNLLKNSCRQEFKYFPNPNSNKTIDILTSTFWKRSQITI